MERGKRLVWLDMAKGLAIILVVLGHCLDSSTAARAFVYSFHMPLFFVLAGFTMRPKPWAQVLVTSFKRLLVPYFIVCTILLVFAFVPPSSLSAALDTQRPPVDVLVEIAFGSGQEGTFAGHPYQAIGALWFLPCLFVARLLMNGVLLVGRRAAQTASAHPALASQLAQAACVAFVGCAGFAIGHETRLPFDLDTACIATVYLYLGYLVKLVGLERIPAPAVVGLAVIWALYPLAGNNEMAIRAYLDNPASLVTSAAASVVVMRACASLEHVPALSRFLATCGVYSLQILCVHRLESAILNWQKIMEFFRPDVWSWSLAQQGFYQFGLRIALVLAVSALLVVSWHRLAGTFARRRTLPPHETR